MPDDATGCVIYREVDGFMAPRFYGVGSLPDGPETTCASCGELIRLVDDRVTPDCDGIWLHALTATETCAARHAQPAEVVPDDHQ